MKQDSGKKTGKKSVPRSGNKSGSAPKKKSITQAIGSLPDRKWAENEMRAMYLRHEAILAAVPDIIVEVDVNKVYTWMNSAGFEFFGDNALGKEAAFFFEGEQDTYDAIQPLFNGASGVIYLESWQRRRDGVKRLLAWWCRVLKDPDGNVTGALSTARDITENKRAEESLRKSEADLRAILDATPFPIAIVDVHDNNINYWSGSALALFGHTAPTTPGWYEIAYPDPEYREEVIQRWKPFLEQARTSSRAVNTGEYRVTCRDGSVRTCEIYAAFHEDRLIVMFNDITERKRAEDDLVSAYRELEAFSYSVSHDLRAPLRSIDGFSQAVLEDYGDRLDDQGRDYLGRLRSASQRMGHLIDDILKLSRVSRNEMCVMPVDLGAIARGIAGELKAGGAERDVDFVIAGDVIVNGDPALLRIVLENLFSNAWKFTGKHPRAVIEFGVSETAGERVMYVRDDGAGFDMKYADKLFNAFQRLHSPDEFEGTGIGLTLAKRIIARHRGRIWAEGAVEKGATIYFQVGQ